MRYMRLWLILVGLGLGACGPTTTLPKPTAPLGTTSVVVNQPTATALTPTLVPEVTVTLAATPVSSTPPDTLPATVTPTAEPTLVLLSGVFVKGEVPVSGSFILDAAHNTLTLSDDFQVVPGPDLYIILSGVGEVTLDFHTFSAQVLEASRLRLGALTNSVGAQTYSIPEGTGLAAFQSVVIWCESFSVEFAAAPLRP